LSNSAIIMASHQFHKAYRMLAKALHNKKKIFNRN